ncbi:MAG: MFS transporter [Chloroflexota bacterium]|nr:MFS transporter [Chloroflexota bacterium]
MTSPEQPHDAIVDYSRKWYVMAAISMGIFLATIDGSIVNVALPTLVDDLNTNFSTIQWVVLSYMLTLTTLMLGIGRLADIRGKKRIYFWGFVLFTIGSLLCAVSSTVEMLIAMRVAQAIGASMILALGPAITTEAFPSSERGKALGVTGSMVSIGIISGPVIGGLILGQASWHWIFLVNLPVGVLGAWMVRRFVPDLPPAGGRRFDFAGAVTLFISMISLLLGLTFGQTAGFTAPAVLALFAGWLIFLIAFILIELRVPEPMIDLRLFRNRLLRVNLFTGFMTFIANSGTILLLPFYLQKARGLDVTAVGLMMAVTPIAVGIVAPLSGSLSDRVGSRPISVAGLIMLLTGFFSAATLTESTPVFGYVLRLLPIGLGMGLFQSPNNSAIMGSVPRRALGVTSGLLAVTRTLGQTVGISIMGAIWAARAIHHNGGRLVPGGPSSAPIPVQVPAMQDTLHVSAALIAVGLVVALWAFRNELRMGAVTPAAQASNEAD